MPLPTPLIIRNLGSQTIGLAELFSGERTRLACRRLRPRDRGFFLIAISLAWLSPEYFGQGAETDTRGRPFDCRSGQAVRSPIFALQHAMRVSIVDHYLGLWVLRFRSF